jgi:hypothetical protein
MNRSVMYAMTDGTTMVVVLQRKVMVLFIRIFVMIIKIMQGNKIR